MVERFLQRLVGIHEPYKPEILVGRRIDKDVDIRLSRRFIAGMGSKQIKRPNAESPQGGFGLL